MNKEGDTMLAGQYQTLKVDRLSPLGYVLSDGVEEYFLHQAEADKKLEPNEMVDVFLYFDSKRRLTATMNKPKITTEQFGWVEVAEVNLQLGVFIEIGINKQILIAPSELPIFQDLWPQVGDMLYCRLKVTGTNYLMGVLARPNEFLEIIENATPDMQSKQVEARVIRTGKIGTNVITTDNVLGFVHESERRGEPRLGEIVTGRVVRVKDDGELNISLVAQKEIIILDDSKTIMDYLEQRNGAMPYGDKTYPEDIKRVFKMSKSSFKRALGTLMKQGKVYQENGWTYVKEEEVQTQEN